MAFIRQHARQQPDLQTIANHVNLSPQHFQRVFLEWAGVSPKKFLQYLTLRHAKNVLAQRAAVLEAAHSTGLSGGGRLHDLFVRLEGVSPGVYRQQGAELQISYSFQSCRFGEYLVASTERGICFLHFYRNPEQVLQELRQAWPKAMLVNEHDKQHAQVAVFLDNALDAQQTPIRLHLAGTPFQLKVWEALLRIPQGHLCTYGNIAQQLGQPNASRAVGTAVGSNPIAFLIPCHRVIRQMGGIGEYRWGSERKMALIGWEAAQQPELAPVSNLPLFNNKV